MKAMARAVETRDAEAFQRLGAERRDRRSDRRERMVERRWCGRGG